MSILLVSIEIVYAEEVIRFLTISRISTSHWIFFILLTSSFSLSLSLFTKIPLYFRLRRMASWSCSTATCESPPRFWESFSRNYPFHLSHPSSISFSSQQHVRGCWWRHHYVIMAQHYEISLVSLYFATRWVMMMSCDVMFDDVVMTSSCRDW